MTYLIENWKDIASRHDSSILIGNGASISVNASFRYDSLKEEAEKSGNIPSRVAAVFGFFGTEDFEYILRVLWHASNVNSALGIAEKATSDAYEGVRKALIETVRAIHPNPSECTDSVTAIATFLKRFDHVVSLNYDVITYWAMMAGNDINDGHAFKDCFIHCEFDEEWQKFSDPIGNQSSCTTVFYPHGNLALARDNLEREIKLSSVAGQPLLETILEKWTNGSHVPLFVSEGTSEQKVRAIKSRNYLRTVSSSVLPSLKGSLAVYGWGFDTRDVHILKSLTNIAALAVSVYGNDQPYCERVVKTVSENLGDHVGITFFDSESDQCWNRA